MKKGNLRSSALLLLTACIWGVAFVAQSVGMEYVGPFTFNFVRSILGGLVLIPCIFFLNRGKKTEAEKKKKWYQDRPVAAELFLGLLVLGCLFCRQIMTKDPSYMDLKNCSVMPCREFLFGTDTMGRDIFSMIWYGGRISLAIGLLSTLISTVIAVLFGAVSGCAPAWLDALLMRLTEIFLSVPNLLLVISSGCCGKIQCDYDFCRDRNDKLDKHYKGCADRSTADPEQ